MTESSELHPVVERTREMVRHTQIFKAREILMALTGPLLEESAREELEKKFPADPDRFFDEFTESLYDPHLKVLGWDCSSCDRDLPGQNGTGAMLVYTASYDNEDEVNQRPDDVPVDDEDWYPDEDATYTETRCWLLSPSMALIATATMGPFDDNDNNASAEFNIVHSDNRGALRAYIEVHLADQKDQIEKAKTVLDEVLGEDSAGYRLTRKTAAPQP